MVDAIYPSFRQVREETESERNEAIASREYWQEIGDKLGLILYGWTYKHRASFIDKDNHRKTIEIDGILGERLYDLLIK